MLNRLCYIYIVCVQKDSRENFILNFSFFSHAIHEIKAYPISVLCILLAYFFAICSQNNFPTQISLQSGINFASLLFWFFAPMHWFGLFIDAMMVRVVCLHSYHFCCCCLALTVNCQITCFIHFHPCNL